MDENWSAGWSACTPPGCKRKEAGWADWSYCTARSCTLRSGCTGRYTKARSGLVQHFNRYVREFARRHNLRPEDTITQMGMVVRGLEGRRLTYRQLKESNGLDSGG